MSRIKYYISQIKQLAKGSVFILSHPGNKGKYLPTIAKMIYWKVNKHFSKYNLQTEIQPGVRCICPYWSSYGGVIYMTKNPEFYETVFIQKAVREKSVVLDIGSNIGYYSLLAASKAVNGRVYAFDVDLRVIEVFNANIKLNRFADRVVLIDELASDKNGFEHFIEEQEAEMNHIAYVNSKKSVKYPSITIDNFIVKHKIRHISVVKIDVEGAEYKVLVGMRLALAQHKIDYLIIELNQNIKKFGFSHETMLQSLQHKGYGIYIFDTDGLNVLDNIKIAKSDINKNILAVSPNVGTEFNKYFH